MTIELKVPAVGESIDSVEIGEWLKTEGDSLRKDEGLVIIDSDKATVEVPSPSDGRLAKILKQKGATVRVGDAIAEIDDHPPAEAPSKTAHPPAQNEATSKTEKPKTEEPKSDEPHATSPQPAAPGPLPSVEVKRHALDSLPGTNRSEHTVRMSPWRRTIARRLVKARLETAMVTTFNEVDMSAVAGMRKAFGEAFERRHHVKLGLMSFFVRASIDALRAFPQINAEIRGEDIVYRNYCDIGVAISTSKGLVVPILRPADHLSFADIERSIADFAARAEANALKPEELEGGTFTISNGGVFGSLASTPIVNPPQSAILGLHVIKDRPIALDGQVVIRPMMYVALTYDHRIVDGREAVLFLGRIKSAVENPNRMLIDC